MKKLFRIKNNNTQHSDTWHFQDKRSPRHRSSDFDGDGWKKILRQWRQHHYHSSFAHSSPLLYEPLLAAVSSLSGTPAFNQAEQEDIDALLNHFSASTLEEIPVLEQLLRAVSPEDQSFSDEGLTLLHIAAKKGFQHSIEILLKHSENSWIAVQNIACKRHGHTPLHLAAMYGFDQCVHTLLNAKADPTIINFAKKTALHYASSYGYSACVNAILNHALGKWKISAASASTSSASKEKSLLNMQDSYGHTALHLAVIDGNVTVVQILLQSHANVTLQDDEQRTALDIARALAEAGSPEHAEMVRMLERGKLKEKTNSGQHIQHTTASPPSLLFEGMNFSSSFNSLAPPHATVLFDGMAMHPPPRHPSPSISRAVSVSGVSVSKVSDTKFDLVPAGRWVVLQSGMLVAEPSGGRVLVHDSRYAAALWAHEWKWAQINKTEDAKWTNRAKRMNRSGFSSDNNCGSSPIPSTSAPSTEILEGRQPPSNPKNIFFTGDHSSATKTVATSKRPSAALTALFTRQKSSMDANVSSHSLDRSSGSSNNSNCHSPTPIQSQNQNYNHNQNHLCVFYDDGSDLFVAEIAAPFWEAFTSTHDFSRVEALGEDPLMESYLLDQVGPRNSHTVHTTHAKAKILLPDLSLSLKELSCKTCPEELLLSTEIALLKEEIFKLQASHDDAAGVANVQIEKEEEKMTVELTRVQTEKNEEKKEKAAKLSKALAEEKKDMKMAVEVARVQTEMKEKEEKEKKAVEETKVQAEEEKKDIKMAVEVARVQTKMKEKEEKEKKTAELAEKEEKKKNEEKAVEEAKVQAEEKEEEEKKKNKEEGKEKARVHSEKEKEEEEEEEEKVDEKKTVKLTRVQAQKNEEKKEKTAEEAKALAEEKEEEKKEQAAEHSSVQAEKKEEKKMAAELAKVLADEEKKDMEMAAEVVRVQAEKEEKEKAADVARVLAEKKKDKEVRREKAANLSRVLVEEEKKDTEVAAEVVRVQAEKGEKEKTADVARVLAEEEKEQAELALRQSSADSLLQRAEMQAETEAREVARLQQASDVAANRAKRQALAEAAEIARLQSEAKVTAEKVHRQATLEATEIARLRAEAASASATSESSSSSEEITLLQSASDATLEAARVQAATEEVAIAKLQTDMEIALNRAKKQRESELLEISIFRNESTKALETARALARELIEGSGDMLAIRDRGVDSDDDSDIE